MIVRQTPSIMSLGVFISNIKQPEHIFLDGFDRFLLVRNQIKVVSFYFVLPCGKPYRRKIYQKALIFDGNTFYCGDD